MGEERGGRTTIDNGQKMGALLLSSVWDHSARFEIP